MNKDDGFIADELLAAAKTTTLNYKTIWERRRTYDLDPPYQRGYVWPKQWKIAFLRALIAGVKIAPISLVQKDGVGAKFWVLDGKQRLGAGLSFMDGEYKLPIKTLSGMKNYGYQQLLKAAEDEKHEIYEQAAGIINSLETARIECTVYPKMGWKEQIDLFTQINHLKELSKQEKFIADVPYVKLLFNFIRANYIGEWVAKTQVSCLTRSKDDEWLYRLLGAVMNCDPREPRASFAGIIGDVKGNTVLFAKDVNDKIKQYMSTTGDDYLFEDKKRVEGMFSTLGWKSVSKNLSFLNDIAKHIPSKDKGKSKGLWPALFFTVFLLEKFEDKILTKAMLSTLPIDSMYAEYLAWVFQKDPDMDKWNLLVRRCNTDDGMAFHKDKLEGLWSAMVADPGRKDTEPTKSERAATFLAAGNQCERCGATNDLQIDHVYGKQNSSSRIFGVLCGPCNRMKSNNSPESLNEFASYFAKHPPRPENMV